LIVVAVDRRRFLKVAGLAGAAAGLAGVTGGCASGGTKLSSRAIRIGVVSSQTGSLAGFGESDAVVLNNIRDTFKDGLEIGGKAYPVKILVRDNGSQPARAAQVAKELIAAKIDLLLTAGAPEVVNPVSDIAEAAGQPALSTSAPWEPWFFGRQPVGGPPQAFTWTYHFFWGLEDIVRVFSNIWQQVPTENKVVASLFAQNADGNAWADPKLGFPGLLSARGYTFIEDPRPQDGASDYRSLLNNFKQSGAQILTGNPQPPDFATFWLQASQARFRPRIATVGKALLFPAFIEVLSPSPVGLASEVWWHPTWPFKSSLTGQTCAEFAAQYISQTHRQWTQPIGPFHALFEVTASVLRRAGLGDPQAIVEAIQQTSLDTIVGRISWPDSKHNKDLPPIAARNVAKSPVVGGQWVNSASRRFRFDLTLVANPNHPEIPVASRVQALPPLE
jgi:branched-chain amino acid transport system substrate-binding protein